MAVTEAEYQSDADGALDWYSASITAIIPL